MLGLHESWRKSCFLTRTVDEDGNGNVRCEWSNFWSENEMVKQFDCTMNNLSVVTIRAMRLKSSGSVVAGSRAVHVNDARDSLGFT